MRNFLFLLMATVALSFVATTTHAADPQDPKAFCDRFVSPIDKEDCQKRVEKAKPDWYLASVCSKQYEDTAFYRCLELSQTHRFSPTKLEACSNSDMNDSQRMTCIRTVATVNSSSEAYQDRRPSHADKRARRFENRR